MIINVFNFGFNSGKGLPNVRIRPALIDWIIFGLAIAIVLAIWILIGAFYKISGPERESFIPFGIAAVICTGAFICGIYAPVRLINFPVRVNEENIYRQHFLLSRFMRIWCLLINISMLFFFFDLLSPILGVMQGLFEIIALSVICIFGFAYIAYFIIAFKWN